MKLTTLAGVLNLAYRVIANSKVNRTEQKASEEQTLDIEEIQSHIANIASAVSPKEKVFDAEVLIIRKPVDLSKSINALEDAITFSEPSDESGDDSVVESLTELRDSLIVALEGTKSING